MQEKENRTEGNAKDRKAAGEVEGFYFHFHWIYCYYIYICNSENVCAALFFLAKRITV